MSSSDDATHDEQFYEVMNEELQQAKAAGRPVPSCEELQRKYPQYADKIAEFFAAQDALRALTGQPPRPDRLPRQAPSREATTIRTSEQKPGPTEPSAVTWKRYVPAGAVVLVVVLGVGTALLVVNRNRVPTPPTDPGNKDAPEAKLPEKPDPNRTAAAWVLTVGGKAKIRTVDKDQDVTALTELPQQSFRLLQLDLTKSSQVTDAGLDHLQGLASLDALLLDYCTKVTDAGLAKLRALKSLRDLRLTETQVTDAGLENLQDLTNLDFLNLNLTRVSNDGLPKLRTLQSLRFLFLCRTKVTDAGLKHLQALTELHTLQLAGPQVTGSGLTALQPLPKLESLALDQSEIDNDGLEHLLALKNLRQLTLTRARRITDAGLKHLLRLPKEMRQLWLTDTGVSAEGIATLKKAFPNADIQ